MKTTEQPFLSVGILSAQRIHFFLHGNYTCEGISFQDSKGVAEIKQGQLTVSLGNTSFQNTSINFVGEDDAASIEIYDVVIGVGFHWERKENQRFKRNLKLVKDGENCIAINLLPLESYLESVISSEMSPKASEALLKAHAVISRSWLLAQITKQKEVTTHYSSSYETDTELIKWYDREDHQLFDVCADDHCQRCCGGVVESFENVWEPKKKPYLVALYDRENEALSEDLQQEEQAKEFITSSPKAFCNTQDAQILSEVLNNYDQETVDFYRWKLRYTQEELSEIIKKRSGIDYGKILDLVPIERGYSGRLKKLKIVGEKCIKTIGKELEIRKTLSESHLYSAAFIVEREGSDFILKGSGWGHGVGLCQIGAAVMGAKGYSYTEILQHYFKNVNLKKIY